MRKPSGAVARYITKPPIKQAGAVPPVLGHEALCGFKQKGLVGVIVDISSQKRLEQELARRVKELEEVRRELRQRA